MNGCWGALPYPLHYLLKLWLLGLCPSMEIIILKYMAHLLYENVCSQWYWKVILIRYCHYSSSVMVSHLRWSWIIPRKIWAVNFVRSCVRLTFIIRQLDPTHLVAKPMRKMSVNWSASALERWLRRSLQTDCATIVTSWKPVSALVLHMTMNRLTVRCLKPWRKGTLQTSFPYVNMNVMNG